MSADPPIPPAPEEWAGAVEVLEWSLARVRRERIGQVEQRLALIEELRICELLLQEAENAENALEDLIAGSVYAGNEKVLARWSAYEERVFPPIIEDPEAADPLPAVESSPAPVALGASASEPLVPPQPPEPSADEPVAVIEPPPHEPEAPAKRDPPPRPAPEGTLTEKQQSVFDALCSVADADWRANISQGRLGKLSGITTYALTMHVDALVKKDHIRILDRGNSTTPATYLICVDKRPARGAPPKSDAELIAEALAAGRVTRVGAPGTDMKH